MTAIVERLSVSPRVERIGNAELWLGDARDVLSGIRNADVIVTDPPYGIGYKTKHRKVASTPAAIANDKEPPLWSIRMCADAIADGGAIYLCTSLAVMPVWATSLAAAGLMRKTPVVWDKGNTTAGDLTGDFGNQVEIVLFAHKGRHRLRAGRISNLWSIPRPPPSEHPTPKPVGLMARCIECSTDTDDLVVDPFMGEGPTGVAAMRLGRSFIGVELVQSYFDTACRRIEREASQGRLL